METELLIISFSIMNIQCCQRWKIRFIDRVGTLAVKRPGEHAVIVNVPTKCVGSWWLFEVIQRERHSTIKIMPSASARLRLPLLVSKTIAVVMVRV